MRVVNEQISSGNSLLTSSSSRIKPENWFFNCEIWNSTGYIVYLCLLECKFTFSCNNLSIQRRTFPEMLTFHHQSPLSSPTSSNVCAFWHSFQLLVLLPVAFCHLLIRCSVSLPFSITYSSPIAQPQKKYLALS